MGVCIRLIHNASVRVIKAERAICITFLGKYV